jgi:hypothetical protein
MELLLSNIPPVRFSKRNTITCFEDLIQDADGIRIAQGISLPTLWLNSKKSLKIIRSLF